ncbi:hypothetical protein BGZ58_001400 [Dissophora ornata]|nr:hypothetical protein BGZ58_001400 [Dissophora ornata]
MMGRSCVGCFEAYEQWQGLIPSGRNYSSNIFSDAYGSGTGFGTGARHTTSNTNESSSKSMTSQPPSRKPNIGRIPDGFLGGESTSEAFGREDIVRQSSSSPANIAIKRQPPTDTAAATHAEHVKAAQELNKLLQERPEPAELVEKNILKDPKVAPALQQHAEELKKAQLEDVLTHKIENRPGPKELIEHNILHETTVAPGIQRQAEEFKRCQLESTLNSKLENRPAPEELIKKHIL